MDEELHWLPDPVPDESEDHYKSFSDLYGTTTSEEHQPSLQPFTGKASEDEQVNKFLFSACRGVRVRVGCVCVCFFFIYIWYDTTQCINGQLVFPQVPHVLIRDPCCLIIFYPLELCDTLN